MAASDPASGLDTALSGGMRRRPLSASAAGSFGASEVEELIVQEERGFTGLWCGIVTSCLVWLAVGGAIAGWASSLLVGGAKLCTAQNIGQHASDTLQFIVVVTTAIAGVWVLLYEAYASAALFGYKGVTPGRTALVIAQPWFSRYTWLSRALRIFSAVAGVPWTMYVVGAAVAANVFHASCSGSAIALVSVVVVALLLHGALQLTYLLCTPEQASAPPAGTDEAVPTGEDPPLPELVGDGSSQAGASGHGAQDPGSVNTGSGRRRRR
ncbi:hypothetical protein FNF27_03878 [Cafeteria roenbergensis]|uniref:Uncharacterized protein n=1 Tax=Cafeteria roenbergensis TaxID=33653 RepID=A0A5A8EAB7_CAFRO|nr:hypothetical protein FNF27_03878 [Cafeteria roenbergensis]